jgi:hypothetical protein
VSWTFVYLMVGLKIPIAALLWLVWWAVHQAPEPSGESGDGGSRRDRHPRPPLPGRPRRRGPHGSPIAAPPPARIRITVARAGAAARHQRLVER